ncbi:palmitoyl-protein thioesterase [Sesbania bispinosa]|nr:palmitoyl-protein thioesterase [Sesbania bispinosa]
MKDLKEGYNNVEHFQGFTIGRSVVEFCEQGIIILPENCKAKVNQPITTCRRKAIIKQCLKLKIKNASCLKTECLVYVLTDKHPLLAKEN